MVEVSRSEGALARSQPEGADFSVAGTASSLINANRDPVLNTAGLQRDLSTLQAAIPEQAQALQQAVLSQLTPREQGNLIRVQETVTTPTQAQTATPTPANDTGPGTAELALDLTQMALDIVGIFEPTPFADGSNAVISLGRSIGSAFRGEGWDALGHLGNGIVSGVSILPYLGDSAKIAKIAGWADTVASAITAAARSPAASAALRGPLGEIRDAVNRIPQGVLDSLPAGARESIERMKTQLDDFFGAGARGADEAVVAGNRVVGNTLVIDANRGTTFTAGGRTQAIGDTPSVRPRDDGRQMVTDVNGQEHIVRQPTSANYDTRVVNGDGTITYTRDGVSVNYDSNGFPDFDARADLYLSPSAINSGSDTAHFREANGMMRDALNADPGLAQRLGLNADQVAFLTRETPSGRSPPDLTWHHHQDTGRIQLVDSSIHDHFSGGHTGGMRIWGGGR
ncbi:HNH endonuclease [Qipengyuania sp. DGS5-3]|uniref:HNH endonuclease n=1 Tax=Qipengyuania sp. DGS5-3 TaxID=3349632 RepID=UPI0036D32378